MSKSDICEVCFGTGQHVTMQPVKRGMEIMHPKECPVCGGTRRQRTPMTATS
jgi:hypothetical protein